MIPNNSFHLISLGCPKNRVDSENILFTMVSAGFLYTENLSAADIVIINTCSFIEAAVEESIDTILDCREENKLALLIVTGCLPSRYKGSLAEALPEVNLFLSHNEIHRLPALLRAHCGLNEREAGVQKNQPSTERHPKKSSSSPARILTTPGYAYLKIAEGCSRRCSYCAIPSIRGPFRSFDADVLKEEASYLADQGARELVLIAQDLTRYGIDRGEKNGLIKLIRILNGIQNVRWIRLLYLYPNTIPSELPKLIQECDKLLPYLDIPIQHVASKVLKGMGRPWKADNIRRIIDRLRCEIPGLVLRTTVMVGFPGEGEKEFRELRDFIESAEIERVGVFTYSPEEGTPAFSMGDPITTEQKQTRADEIRSIHSQFENRRNKSRLGKVEQALIEGVSSESEFLLQARVWDQAPEIDGMLYITAGEGKLAEIQNVRITEFHGSDLFGEITPSP